MEAKQKTKKVKVQKQKKKLFRTNDPMLSVFMWGVNYSITGLQHVEDPPLLLPEHFKSHTKVRVDNHLHNKENMPSHYKVKEYCPLVFRNIRERFNIYDEDYVNSLTRAQPLDMIDSSGKSNKYYLTTDKLFIIKIISSEDVEGIHGILMPYHQHIVETHARTIIPHILSIYRLTVGDAETYIMVMRNAFSSYRKIHKKYDIKGSTVDRAASDKEKNKDLPTLKDMDLINDEVKIRLGTTVKDEFMSTLHTDVEWMSKLNLMDYSLLIGIHDIERAEQEEDEESVRDEENGMTSEDEGPSTAPRVTFQDGSGEPRNPLQDDSHLDNFAYRSNDDSHKEIYHMCLIDIFTHYGMRKKTANAAKQVKHGREAEISTVKPEQYAKRFTDFIQSFII